MITCITYKNDQVTIIVTPLQKRARFPERYSVVQENGDWFVKQLFGEPIPLGKLPAGYELVSHNKQQIIFSNGQAPKPKRKRKYKRL